MSRMTRREARKATEKVQAKAKSTNSVATFELQREGPFALATTAIRPSVRIAVATTSMFVEGVLVSVQCMPARTAKHLLRFRGITIDVA